MKVRLDTDERGAFSTCEQAPWLIALNIYWALLTNFEAILPGTSFFGLASWTGEWQDLSQGFPTLTHSSTGRSSNDEDQSTKINITWSTMAKIGSTVVRLWYGWTCLGSSSMLILLTKVANTTHLSITTARWHENESTLQGRWTCSCWHNFSRQRSDHLPF